MEHLSYASIIQQFPNPESNSLRSEISEYLATNKIKIVILDDDPTGIQTVHDCLLLTKWDELNINKAFLYEIPFFYILTNTRSLTETEAKSSIQSAVNAVLKVNSKYNYKLIFISRSDSTLRGHFPLEPDTICATLRQNNISYEMPVFFIPSFLEVGRFTINNVQYLRNNDDLIPASETEFARDNVFGYSNSNLPEYIIEKSKATIEKKDIKSFSLHDLRENKIEDIIQKIHSYKNAAYITVDALDYFDLRKFAISVLHLLSDSSPYLVLRTSSSFPKALSGIDDKPLLTKKNLEIKQGIGIFIVGSHVKKTTLQLEKLLENSNTRGIELNITEIINDPKSTLSLTKDKIGEYVKDGCTPVVYTSRQEVRIDNKEERLAIGKKISAFILHIMKDLPFKPAYIVAKGGITSNDILTDSLNIDNAIVAGQILTGVPVIVTDKTHIYPNLPYIIFPGNVGDENSMLEVFLKLV